jgi:pimeloyl-[acyl-carrier protein] methyl ester esterase
MTILFIHGWGFDAGFWRPLANRLPDFRPEVVDLGFFGEPVTPTPERPLVVAHSMGLAWALAHLPRPWAGVVAVNAFARFTRSPSFVEGVTPRLVERMLSRFDSEPETVLRDFLCRCGVEAPVLDGMRQAPLRDALAWLAECDEQAALAALDCPLLALSGTRDLVVPETMSRAAFNACDLVLVEGAGHTLPLSHPDWVASQIRQFAARAA